MDIKLKHLLDPDTVLDEPFVDRLCRVRHEHPTSKVRLCKNIRKTGCMVQMETESSISRYIAKADNMDVMTDKSTKLASKGSRHNETTGPLIKKGSQTVCIGVCKNIGSKIGHMAGSLQ